MYKELKLPISDFPQAFAVLGTLYISGDILNRYTNVSEDNHVRILGESLHRTWGMPGLYTGYRGRSSADANELHRACEMLRYIYPDIFTPKTEALTNMHRIRVLE